MSRTTHLYRRFKREHASWLGWADVLVTFCAACIMAGMIAYAIIGG